MFKACNSSKLVQSQVEGAVNEASQVGLGNLGRRMEKEKKVGKVWKSMVMIGSFPPDRFLAFVIF